MSETSRGDAARYAWILGAAGNTRREGTSTTNDHPTFIGTVDNGLRVAGGAPETPDRGQHLGLPLSQRGRRRHVDQAAQGVRPCPHVRGDAEVADATGNVDTTTSPIPRRMNAAVFVKNSLCAGGRIKRAVVQYKSGLDGPNLRPVLLPPRGPFPWLCK